MSKCKQHYTVFSPWGGMILGCLRDNPGKDGPAVRDERDVILKSSSAENCSHCDKGEHVSLMDIVKEGKNQGKSAYDSLKEAGFIKGHEFL